MRKPRHAFDLPLGGHIVTVHWVKGLREKESADGTWDRDRLRIDLDCRLTGTEAQETLIHEAAHAVSDLYDLNLSERQVRQLAIGQHQMLRPFLKAIR